MTQLKKQIHIVQRVFLIALFIIFSTACDGNGATDESISGNSSALNYVRDACASGFFLLGDDSNDGLPYLIQAAKLDNFYVQHVEAVLSFSKRVELNVSDVNSQIDSAIKISALCQVIGKEE